MPLIRKVYGRSIFNRQRCGNKPGRFGHVSPGGKLCFNHVEVIAYSCKLCGSASAGSGDILDRKSVV